MTTLLRLAACLMALLLGAGAAHAAGFDLITAAEAVEEAQAEASAPPEARTRGITLPKDGAPAIRVVVPAATTAAGATATGAAPVRIEVAFKPAPGARIVPSTFRVLYGLLKIDLTDRLRRNASVTESGVVVENAQMPAGQHRLILQVGDDKGNTTEQELRIRVASAS